MGNACATDKKLDNRPITNHEINVDQSHAMRGPEMNDQFHANRAEDENPYSQDGHPPRRDHYFGRTLGIDTGPMGCLDEIDAFRERTNHRVNLTLSRVGDLHHSTRLPEGKIIFP